MPGAMFRARATNTNDTVSPPSPHHQLREKVKHRNLHTRSRTQTPGNDAQEELTQSAWSCWEGFTEKEPLSWVLKDE